MDDMTIPDDRLPEADTDQIHKPNPAILDLMTALVQDGLEHDPSIHVPTAIYVTVKTVLRNPQIRPHLVSVIPAIFVYYLEVYKTLNPEQLESETQIYNQGVLSLFDLYVQTPHDHTLRRLLNMGAKAAHEVITARLAQNKDLTLKQAMARISQVALITETVNSYIASSRRVKNVPYMNWVRTFLTYALDSDDLVEIDTDKTLFAISEQIKDRKPIIKVPTSLN